MKKNIAMAIAWVFVSACASTGALKESKELRQGLNGYDAVQFAVTAADSKNMKWARLLKTQLEADLKKEAKFRTPASKKGKVLTVRVKIIEHKKGDPAKRALNLGGEARLKALGRLLDKKTELSEFTAEGNSMRTSQTTVGGVPITKMKSLGDDLTARAVIALSEQVVEYLNDHR